ncbi:MAG: tetraacyldisaccharide 4'-kinase [Leptospirillia bacterium]
MKPLGPLAFPLALLYGAGVSLFRGGYESGLRRRERFSVPVVSIGNIEAGGTGKSPLVAALCQKILDLAKRPGVVSRGYGRVNPGADLLISRGEGLLVGVEEAGDEPALLVKKVPGTSVAVAGDRRAGIRRLSGLCDIILLDDGFQSLEVLPDLSFVFLPFEMARRPMGLGDLLPAGPLREPPGVLSRATHWVLGGPEKMEVSGLLSNLSRIVGPGKMRPILRTQFRLSAFRDFDGASQTPLESLSGRTVAVVAGIANPQRVEEALNGVGARVAGLLALPDHAPFDSSTREKIRKFSLEMAGEGAEILLTTEKDRIKWTDLPESPLPVGVLEGESLLLDLPEWERILSRLISGGF